MPLTSFFNNHKQNRSATALPAGNNNSSSSLPSPNPQNQPPGAGLIPQPHPQEYQAYSPPPESLSAQQQFAAQLQQQQLQQQQQQQARSSQLPARHQSVSGPASGPGGPQYGARNDIPHGALGGGLILHGGGAAESQQTLLNDRDNSDNLSYTSSTAYGSETGGHPQQAAPPAPAKSTLRKPLVAKEPSSGHHHGISGLFHRNKAPEQEESGGLGRKNSTRKSSQSTPQQSPNIPQQIDEDQYSEARSPRPQSLLPPAREQVEHLVALRRSDTDAQTYAQRPAPPILQPIAQRPSSQGHGQPQPYYNINTGQYDTAPPPSHQSQNLPPGQQQHQPQPQQQLHSPQSQVPQTPHQQQHPQQLPLHSQQGQQGQQRPLGSSQGPPGPPLQQTQPRAPGLRDSNPLPPHQSHHQPPPQQQYPGHQQQLSQSQTYQQQQQQQLQKPPAYNRSSSEISTQEDPNSNSIQLITNHPGGGLQAAHQNNQPVSPGASVHTVDTMPGGNAGNQGGPPAGQDGRSTPVAKPEGAGGSGMSPSQVQALLTEFDTLQSKYRKVKNLYFEKNHEIERLQNTMANQRMSQSRTALDDNQYSSRFERLDGAIKNLAFEIRQSWKVIPGWLQPVVNPGAEVKGGREMTVVGRAAISRWVVDEILDRFFHPGLDPAISMALKNIENGIRRNSPQPQSVEEDDNLSSKVCQWRMSTVDGIRPVIESQQGRDAHDKMKAMLEEKLMASLAMHLNEPLPPGLPGGVTTIIDIAIGLASNLPLESRDVRVWYPLPGEKFDNVFMRTETGLQPLINAEGADSKATNIMVDGKPISQVEKGGTPPPNTKDDPAAAGLTPSNSVKGAPETSKKSVFKGLKGKIQGATGGGNPAPPPQQQANPSQTSLMESAATGPPPPTKTENSVPGPPPVQQQEKVRVAGFMAVEVRGKSILIKAPVWT